MNLSVHDNTGGGVPPVFVFFLPRDDITVTSVWYANPIF